MDKLLQNLIKKRLQKSFPGSLQIWKQGNPRHQMFLFYFIPLEGEPYQLREGTQSPSFMGAGSGTEAAPHRARPQHGPQLLPRTMFLEGRAQGLGPRFSARLQPGAQQLWVCRPLRTILPSHGTSVPRCTLHVGNVGGREASTAEASR